MDILNFVKSKAGWYVIILLVILIAAPVVVAIAEGNDTGILQKIVTVGEKSEPLIIVGALLTFTAIEGIAMLARQYDKHLRQRDRAKGREQGREEAQAEFRHDLARWIESNPAIKKAIDTGDVQPPPWVPKDREHTPSP